MSGRDTDADPTVLGLPAHDLETLADYVGGALAGTPAEAEVAERIAADPTWGAAHAALAGATARVSTALGEWGRAAEPMPADVAERLSAALATAHSPAPDGLAAAPPPGDGAGGEGSRPPLTVVPGGVRAARRPGGRPRWQRWAGGLAAAAGVLAFCGIGAKVIGPIDGPMSAGGSSADRPAITTENGPAGSDLTDLTVQQQIASGADYRRQTLAQRVAPAAPFAGSSVAPGNGAGPGESGQDKNSGGAPGAQAVAAPAALRPLTEPVALDRCLGAIGTEHGRQAVSVDLVDYASFEGTPAVIVVFTDVSGERWGWVVGPACGRADAGADSRYRTTVG